MKKEEQKLVSFINKTKSIIQDMKFMDLETMQMSEEYYKAQDGLKIAYDSLVKILGMI